MLIISVNMRGHMKYRTLGYQICPKKSGVPLLGFAQSFNHFSPPAQKRSQTILTISEYRCHTAKGRPNATIGGLKTGIGFRQTDNLAQTSVKQQLHVHTQSN